jgi:hypothetical protein
MFGDVEAFALDFFLHAQTDGQLDEAEHERAADADQTRVVATPLSCAITCGTMPG